ncbi:MAG: acetyltransferase [Halothece sp.]
MFLKHKPTGDLVEVLTLREIYDPWEKMIQGRYHAGEEIQDPEPFPKDKLMFPSGESLPQCWLDPTYLKHLPKKTAIAL